MVYVQYTYVRRHRINDVQSKEKKLIGKSRSIENKHEV